MAIIVTLILAPTALAKRHEAPTDERNVELSAKA